MKILTWLPALLFLLFFHFSARCQGYWENSLSFGALSYYGDMSREFIASDGLKPSVQLAFSRYFDSQHAVRFNMLYGKIAGDDRNDASLAQRGNTFQANVFEASIIGQIDLVGNDRFSPLVGFRRILTPYFLVGGGVIFANPKVTYSNPNNEDAGIDYPNVHIFAPVGGGLKYDLSLKVYLGMEAGLRFTISDYLDGVQASGNAYSNDGYFFGGFTVGYRFIN